MKPLKTLIEYIKEQNGKLNKSELSKKIVEKFNLVKDGPVFYQHKKKFAIRFSESKGSSFSNTVLSLSRLQKYDNEPFIVCLITPKKNFLYISNSTFLQKISHSSLKLRVDNIKGSIIFCTPFHRILMKNL